MNGDITVIREASVDLAWPPNRAAFDAALDRLEAQLDSTIESVTEERLAHEYLDEVSGVASRTTPDGGKWSLRARMKFVVENYDRERAMRLDAIKATEAAEEKIFRFEAALEEVDAASSLPYHSDSLDILTHVHRVAHRALRGFLNVEEEK